MTKGKHEPTCSDEYMAWRANNCYRCQRFDFEEGPPLTCAWELQYDNYAWMGCERPSDEIIPAMFDKPLCRKLIRNDLELLLNPEKE